MEIQRDMILKSFTVETGEGLAQMEETILELEARPEDGELIQTIFRVVHTIKGNASILELPKLQAFAHAFENLLDEIRSRNLSVTPEIINLMLASLDILREMGAGAAKGRDETSARAREVLGRISKCIAGGAQSGSTRLEGENGTAVEPGAVRTPPVNDSLRSLRVDVTKLDRLLDLTGEIAIARGRIAQLLENPGAADLVAIRETARAADSLH